MDQITVKDEISTLICASRLPSQIGCLFAHENYVGLKSNYKNLEQNLFFLIVIKVKFSLCILLLWY